MISIGCIFSTTTKTIKYIRTLLIYITMGCCSSKDDEDNLANGGSAVSETEMQRRKAAAEDDPANAVLSIAKGMSSKTITIQDRTRISGYGLALAGVSIEQDAAYWEIHVTSAGTDERLDVLVGLATKKDRKYFDSTTITTGEDTIDLDNTDDEYRKKSGIEFMSKIPVSNNDVIGIVVQQSDLPMIQFYLNGTQQYYASINRFRGSIYPSFYIPSSASNNNVTLQVVFLEQDFRQPIPNHACSPVMVARGLM